MLTPIQTIKINGQERFVAKRPYGIEALSSRKGINVKIINVNISDIIKDRTHLLLNFYTISTKRTSNAL